MSDSPILPPEPATDWWDALLARGRAHAAAKKGLSALDHLDAILDANRFQALRLQEVHVILANGGEVAAWLDATLIALVQQEGAKQAHAEALIAARDGDTVMETHLDSAQRDAVAAMARGEIREELRSAVNAVWKGGLTIHRPEDLRDLPPPPGTRQRTPALKPRRG